MWTLRLICQLFGSKGKLELTEPNEQTWMHNITATAARNHCSFLQVWLVYLLLFGLTPSKSKREKNGEWERAIELRAAKQYNIAFTLSHIPFIRVYLFLSSHKTVSHFDIPAVKCSRGAILYTHLMCPCCYIEHVFDCFVFVWKVTV